MNETEIQPSNQAYIWGLIFTLSPHQCSVVWSCKTPLQFSMLSPTVNYFKTNADQVHATIHFTKENNYFSTQRYFWHQNQFFQLWTPMNLVVQWFNSILGAQSQGWPPTSNVNHKSDLLIKSARNWRFPWTSGWVQQFARTGHRTQGNSLFTIIALW